jgi:hypothetical protein
MVAERERFPARKKYRKLTPEEAKEQSDSLLRNPGFVSRLEEARAARSRGDWVRWSDVKKQNGRS